MPGKTQLVEIALSGVAQWIECWPANQRVANSIPIQGTRLGCGPGPQWGARERQPHIDVSLRLSLPPFPFLKLNKIFKKKEEIIVDICYWNPHSSCRHSSSRAWHWEDRKVIIQVMGLGCPPLGNPLQQEQGGLCLGLPHAGEGVMGSSLIVRYLSVLNLALVLRKV